MDELPKKKIVSVNPNHVVFCLLLTHDNLPMQALVWLHVVLRGTVQFRARYVNLKTTQNLRKSLFLHLGKYGISVVLVLPPLFFRKLASLMCCCRVLGQSVTKVIQFVSSQDV